MNKQKIKLAANVPCTFTLENDSPREMSSKFSDGVEYMYSVECQGDPSILFLPVDGRLALQRAGAKAGDEVQLTKTLHNNRAVYTARVFSDAHLAIDAAPPPQRPAAQAAAAPRGFGPAPVAQPTPMLAPQSQIAPARTPAAPSLLPGGSAEMLAKCLTAAIDAALGAESYAAAKGKTLAFNEEDVRAMALSIYIGKQREGSR